VGAAATRLEGEEYHRGQGTVPATCRRSRAQALVPRPDREAVSLVLRRAGASRISQPPARLAIAGDPIIIYCYVLRP